jgi:hypothetical protein
MRGDIYMLLCPVVDLFYGCLKALFYSSRRKFQILKKPRVVERESRYVKPHVRWTEAAYTQALRVQIVFTGIKFIQCLP